MATVKVWCQGLVRRLESSTNARRCQLPFPHTLVPHNVETESERENKNQRLPVLLIERHDQEAPMDVPLFAYVCIGGGGGSPTFIFWILAVSALCQTLATHQALLLLSPWCDHLQSQLMDPGGESRCHSWGLGNLRHQRAWWEKTLSDAASVRQFILMERKGYFKLLEGKMWLSGWVYILGWC